MADIAAVVRELQQERARLDEAIRVLGTLNGRGSAGTGAGVARAMKTLSAAARQRIAAAQRARWAKIKSAGTPKAQSATKRRPTRILSAAARRKIAAAQKARWAKLKATAKRAA